MESSSSSFAPVCKASYLSAPELKLHIEPSNYRECVIVNGLQKRRDNLNKIIKAHTQPRTFQPNKVNREVLYAQVTKAHRNKGNEQQSLLQMVKWMNQQT